MLQGIPRFSLAIVLCAGVLLAEARCQQTQTKSPAAAPRPRIGLALGGGGALGLAHIGVLEWFDEHHIPVDVLAGTSMGSLVGGLYATGRSGHEIEGIVSDDVLAKVFRLSEAYADLSYRRRQDQREFPHGVKVGLRPTIGFRNSVLIDRGLNELLDTLLVNYNHESLDFDALPIPFRCVATDLNQPVPVVLRSGPLPDAIRASVSIPGVFSPVEHKGSYLIDGGLLENLPTQELKAMKADVLIAVSFPIAPLTRSDVNSITGILLRTFSISIERNEEESRKLANVLITPKIGTFTTSDYDHSSDLIRIGYESAEAHRAELLRYALSDEDWRAHRAARNARRQRSAPLLRKVLVEGGSPRIRSNVEAELRQEEGKPLDPARIEQRLDRVRSDGRYDADYGTETYGDGEALQVRIHGPQSGPPVLLVGADLSAVSGSPIRGTIDARLIHQDIGTYGSELRAEARLGTLTDLTAEYYWRLVPTRFFWQPRVELLREPVYIYDRQRRIAERSEHALGGGVDVGYTFEPLSQLTAEWRDFAVNWRSVTGSDGRPDVSGVAQTARLRFTHFGTDRALVAQRGSRVDASVGYLFQSVGGANAPVAALALAHYFPLNDKSALSVSFDGRTYFRRHVADPLQFTLGGPVQLSASAVDEYRGTDYALTRAVYLRKIGSLPSPLEGHIYGAFAYEAGEMWSPVRPAFLRQDGVLGVIAETPLGAITLGYSAGDAGHRKVFFTFGRLFGAGVVRTR